MLILERRENNKIIIIKNNMVKPYTVHTYTVTHSNQFRVKEKTTRVQESKRLFGKKSGKFLYKTSVGEISFYLF